MGSWLSKTFFLISTLSLFTVFAAANPISVGDSAGVCEAYGDLAGVDDEVLDCSPGPNFDVCGAYPWDERVVMQGSEVDSAVKDYEAHYEACLDTRTQQGYCVLGNDTQGTELVEEGTVANLAPFHHDTSYHQDNYQVGGHSPDRSVCSALT